MSTSQHLLEFTDKRGVLFSLHLRRSVFRSLQAELRSIYYPRESFEADAHEVMYLLVGTRAQSHASCVITVVDFAPLPLKSSSRIHGEVDNAAFNEVVKRACGSGTIPVGWLHTHPGMPVFLGDDDQILHANLFTEDDVAIVVDPESWKAVVAAQDKTEHPLSIERCTTEPAPEPVRRYGRKRPVVEPVPIQIDLEDEPETELLLQPLLTESNAEVVERPPPAERAKTDASAPTEAPPAIPPADAPLVFVPRRERGRGVLAAVGVIAVLGMLIAPFVGTVSPAPTKPVVKRSRGVHIVVSSGERAEAPQGTSPELEPNPEPKPNPKPKRRSRRRSRARKAKPAPKVPRRPDPTEQKVDERVSVLEREDQVEIEVETKIRATRATLARPGSEKACALTKTTSMYARVEVDKDTFACLVGSDWQIRLYAGQELVTAVGREDLEEHREKHGGRRCPKAAEPTDDDSAGARKETRSESSDATVEPPNDSSTSVARR